jgi:excisionase family DNA binding protein
MEKRLIGLFPAGHVIRIFLPMGSGTNAEEFTKDTLAGMFNGAVSYPATLGYDRNGRRESETVTVVETHANDAQLREHQDKLDELHRHLERELGVEILLDVNGRNLPLQVEAPPVRVYSTEQAAEYLGVSIDTIKTHVHRMKDLQAEKVGPALYFTQEELDRFKATRPRRRGKK